MEKVLREFFKRGAVKSVPDVQVQRAHCRCWLICWFGTKLGLLTRLWCSRLSEMLKGSAGLGVQSGRAQGAVNTLQAVTPMLLENAESCCTDCHHLPIKTIFLYGKYMAAAGVSKTT